MISVSTLLIFGESKHALGDYVGCGYGLDIIGFWRTENQRITCRRGHLFQRPSQPRAS